jgi:hypothetical protein
VKSVMVSLLDPKIQPGHNPEDNERQVRETLERALRRTQDNFDELLARTAALETNSVAQAFGSMYQRSAPAVPDILDGVWQTLPFDTASLLNVGVVPDVDTDSWSYSSPGVFSLSVELNARVVEAQAGRTALLRLWSITEDTLVGGIVPIGLGRNTDVLQSSSTIQAGVLGAGGEYRLEIQGYGSDIVVVAWDVISFSTNRVSRAAEF